MNQPLRASRAPRHDNGHRLPAACAVSLVLVTALPLVAQPTPAPEPRGGAAGATVVTAQPKIEVAVSDNGQITLRCPAESLSTLLEILSIQSRTNIVATKSVSGTVSANLYNVSMSEALDALLIPNGLTHRRIKNVVYVGTPEEIAANGPPPEMRVFHLNYISRSEAVTAAQALLSPQGSIAGASAPSTGGPAPVGGAFGGGGGASAAAFADAGVDYLVITDAPDRLDAIAALFDELDVRPRQVLIEATILRATLSEQNRLGVDLSLLSGVDFQDLDASSQAATNLTLGQVPDNKFENTTFNLSSDFVGQFPNGGFTFGIIRNNVAAFVRALEDVTDVTVLAHPKVVALNKQPAEVIVGRRDGYLTTTVTETAAVQNVEFLETGTQIQLIPLINPDGTVRLDVRPKDSNGGLTAANLPFEETTEAHAQLMIENGHTVMIGGLFRERTVSSKSQIPVLGDIPVAGNLFRKTSDETVREEVIILLTVRVLEDTPAQQQQMEELMEDVERIRVGSRRGLMGTGRERLAQAFYQEALAQAEAGRFDRALLNVRMALHNHPRHIAAIKLKEALLGERMWESEGVRIRDFAFELIEAAEPGQEVGPDYGRPDAHEELLEGVYAPSAPQSDKKDETP